MGLRHRPPACLNSWLSLQKSHVRTGNRRTEHVITREHHGHRREQVSRSLNPAGEHKGLHCFNCDHHLVVARGYAIDPYLLFSYVISVCNVSKELIIDARHSVLTGVQFFWLWENMSSVGHDEFHHSNNI